MKLLVVRHAVAMERSEFHGLGQTDDDLRPLTEEGARKMRKGARGLRRILGRPGALISSPLLRAVQTADILERAWPEIPRELCEALRPESAPAEFGRWLKARPDALKDDDCIAIVGHEPHLSGLVSWYLFGRPDSRLLLKKGGVCLLEIPSPIPKGLARGHAKLLWMLAPSQLRLVT